MDLSSFQREYFEVFRELPPEKREFVLQLMRRCVSGGITQERLADLIQEVRQGKSLDELKENL